MTSAPLILYVPGLRPKPPPPLHREQLLRCLLESVERIDSEVASQIRTANGAFDIAGWTFEFYAEHRDLELDRRAIDRLLQQEEPSARDIAEAQSLKRRVVRGLYHVADRLPFLIPQFADETMQLHLRDLRRYMKNESDIAEAIRRVLKMPLRTAARTKRPVLLIGHSMGSVIAYESLWQLSREPSHDTDVSLQVDFLTIGSPLGMRYIQRFLIGRAEEGERRYPRNIRRWDNIAAVGELTAIDMRVRDDFADMVKFGVTDNIRDIIVYNWFRQHGVLNVHSEYGYLANAVTASRVCDWWRKSSGSTLSSKSSG